MNDRMSVRNVRTIWQELSFTAALAVAIILMPASALAQSQWKVTVDAENQVPDKLQLSAEGPSLSGTPATGGLIGSFLVEYGAPIDATVEFPILSSSVAGGVIVITGGTTGPAAARDHGMPHLIHWLIRETNP